MNPGALPVTPTPAASAVYRPIAKMKRTFLLSLAAFLAVSCISRAGVRLPAIFGDHMVLQQDRKIPVWGWADPGETVTVKFAGRSAQTVAGADGKWRLDLAPVPANAAPGTLTVAGKTTVQFQDVLVGDVWLAGGQSNMQFGIHMALAREEVLKADRPLIRTFLVPNATAPLPREDLAPPAAPLEGKWQLCVADNLNRPGGWNGFTAVGLFFALDIQKFTGRPVGVIGSYRGGTPAQSWTSLSGLQKDPPFTAYAQQNLRSQEAYATLKAAYPPLLANFLTAKKAWDAEVKPGFDAASKAWALAATQAKAAGSPPPPKPQPARPEPRPPQDPNPSNQWGASLYNGMIAPLIPYALKGVIWYQGEANVTRAEEYRTLFPRMISDWREKWGQGDFPFLFVQLAGYSAGGPNEDFALLREAQLKTLSLPNTGMASAVDIGAGPNIHPPDKKDVGLRLAAAAKHLAYGQDNVPSGPLYEAMRLEGSHIRLTFKNVGGGLTPGTPPWSRPGAPTLPADALAGFTVAGADRHWAPAEARIEGNSVVVSSAQVPAPVAVRYGWANDPVCNLYNREGLPASPFRTDEWKP